MLTFYYTFNFYKFIKSGLSLDFYVKRLVYMISLNFFYFFSIIFGEKYLIEYLFLSIGSWNSNIFFLLINNRRLFSIFFLNLSWFIIFILMFINCFVYI